MANRTYKTAQQVRIVVEDLEEAVRHIDAISKDNRTEELDKKLNEAADCIYMAQKFLASIHFDDDAPSVNGEHIMIKVKRKRIKTNE